ncbi:MAG: response regulator [Rhodothermales bacterium]
MYTVRTAENGEDAPAKVAENMPDLIISDIMMPKMDGFQLQQTLQEQQSTRAIPFIFLTAKADDNSRLKGPAHGDRRLYHGSRSTSTSSFSRIERLLERTRLFQTQPGRAHRPGLLQQAGCPSGCLKWMAMLSATSTGPATRRRRLLLTGRRHPPASTLPSATSWGKASGEILRLQLPQLYPRHALRDAQDDLIAVDLIRRVNQIIMEDEMMEDTFASLLLMRWEPAKNEIAYTNAGHCRPVPVSPDKTEVVPRQRRHPRAGQIRGIYVDTTIKMPAVAPRSLRIPTACNAPPPARCSARKASPALPPAP